MPLKVGMKIFKNTLSSFLFSGAIFWVCFLKAYPEWPLEDNKTPNFILQADSYSRAGQYGKALAIYSSLLSNRFLTPKLRASVFVSAGTAYWNSGDINSAARSYQDAFSLSRKLDNEVLVSQADLFIRILNFYQNGKSQKSSGDIEGSISSFKKAIALAKQANSKDHEIKPARLLSLVYWDEKDYASFKMLNERALDLARLINNRREQGNCLNNIGLYYWRYDDYSKALTFFQSASSIAKDISDLYLLNETLVNQTVVYKDLGDLDTALTYALDTLDLDKKEELKSQVAVDYLNIGVIYRQRALLQSRPTDFDKAYSFFNYSLEYATADKNLALRLGALNNLGNLYADKGEQLKAKSLFEEAEELANEIGDQENLGQISNNLGLLETTLGNYEMAATHFQKAIDIAQRLGSGQVLWEAYFELGNSLFKQGKYREAFNSYRTSISIIENIRSTIRLEEYKASYLGSDKRLDAYYNIIGLLAKIDNSILINPPLPEAFHYLERAKARAFLDTLEIADINFEDSADIRLVSQEKSLMRDISKIYTKLLNTSLSNEERDGFDKKIEDYEEELEKLKQEIREASPAYANLRYPKIITFDDVRANLLKSATTIIAYAVGKDTTVGFAISRGRLKTFPLPPRPELQRRISEYRKLISDSAATDFRLGHELFRDLVLPGLDSHTKKLVIIPDDILHLLPFEALVTEPSSTHWLIEDFIVSYAPSLSSLKYLMDRQAIRRKHIKDLLAFGDPYYGPSEETLGNSLSGAIDEFFPLSPSSVTRLKYSGLEVKSLASLFKKSRVDIHLRQTATEEAVKSAPLKDYRIIHFASHAFIDDKKPARSAILLSLDQDPAEDGLLQTREIFNLKISADLVVLSACQTGLGQFIRGEGIEGLNRAFFYAGASSVLISLWSVNDQATSRLMQNFYRHLKDADTPAQSLRAAKLEMIQTQATSHPFYWAGFIVTGDADYRIFGSKRIWAFLLAAVILTAAAVCVYILRSRRPDPHE